SRLHKYFVFFFQAEDGIRDFHVTGVQTCALPILNLELGYRYSDYLFQGGIDTYKALVDWGITEQLRFRGGRQLATRAPNIAEMRSEERRVGEECIGGSEM